jgi:hypothetical protein
MRRKSLVLVVLAAAVVGLTVFFGPLTGATGLTLGRMIADAELISLLMDAVLCLILVTVLVIGVLLLSTDKISTRSGFLSLMTFVGPLLALLAAAESTYLHWWYAMRYAHTINIAVLAPSIVEALMSLSIGLLIAVTASLLNDLFAARAHRKA